MNTEIIQYIFTTETNVFFFYIHSSFDLRRLLKEGESIPYRELIFKIRQDWQKNTTFPQLGD